MAGEGRSLISRSENDYNTRMCWATPMCYDSHARFLFIATQKQALDELRAHLVSLGMPAKRLLESGT